MDVLRKLDVWGTTQSRIHGEQHFREHLTQQFGPKQGIDKIYFSDNPRTIHEENDLTVAA
jgi:hypothetical protein